jgi:hypothetical protein
MASDSGAYCIERQHPNELPLGLCEAQMSRAVVSVATTEQYRRGLRRLAEKLPELGAIGATEQHCRAVTRQLTDGLPPGWPTHEEKPYAFKSYALHAASKIFDCLVWCDASVVPIRSLEPLWERIERYGYWMSRSGWNNYQWTADSAYPDLFPIQTEISSIDWRALNHKIPHVVAGAFGLNVRHELGRAFLDEYYRLASTTRAFCGPWINANRPEYAGMPHTARLAPCGPPDVLGHRHDASCASVIAWRLGFELTEPPDIFSYGKASEPQDERTILLADGSIFA